MNAVRLSVTIPEDEFKKIEEVKKREHINRSALLQQIIKSFFEKEDEEDKISRYVAGYKKKPEMIKEISGLEKAQIETLGEF